jgi:hypothetical protein
MNIHGLCLAFPFRVDERGTLATTNDPAQIAEQFLVDLIETRLGEHVQTPGYGMPDRAFSVMGASFTALLAAELEEQVRNYLPIIKSIEVLAGELDGDRFTPGFTLDQQRAAVRVEYVIQGESVPRNLVFPAVQFRGTV